MGERNYLSIGDVLALLRSEFPDITISKIRFLESRGLLVPERTPSGYRKFYDHDVDRLRWILRQQREHFLPLKVIKGRLEGADGSSQPESLFDEAEPPPAGPEEATELATRLSANGSVHPSIGFAARQEPGRVATMEHGDEAERELAAVRPIATAGESHAGDAAPEPAGPPAGRAPEPEEAPEPVAPASAGPVASELLGASLTAAELAGAAGLSVAEVEQLESYGLIEGRKVAGVHCYGAETVEVAKLAAGFAAHGIEARHLRIFLHAAERQAGLYSQSVMPLLRQRNPEARARAVSNLREMAALGSAIQSAFVQARLEDLTGG